MTRKNVFYAAVGAPVVAARKVVDAVNELRSTLNKEADSVGKTANKRVEVWATEGEKIVNRITDAKMVDELTSKVDFEQVSTQVSKLRDQLEDMLNTWRASFRPEKHPTEKLPTVKLPSVKVETSAGAVKVEAKTAPATKTASKKASKKAAATKAPIKAPSTKAAAKKAAAKSSRAAKVTAKSPARAKKASAQKAPAKKVQAKTAS